MTEDNQYTPPPGVLVPDAAAPPAPPAPPAPAGFPPAFPAGASALQPLGGLAATAIAMTGLYAALSLVSAALSAQTVEKLKDTFADPDNASIDFTSSILGLVGLAVSVGSFVFLALWMSRLRANRAALGQTPGGPPAVEWWGWFIPFANFVLPFLGMRAVTRRLVSLGVLLAWWIPFCAMWVIQPLVASAQFRAINFSTGKLVHPEVLDTMPPLSWAMAALIALSWVFLAVTIRQATARHTQSNGTAA